MLKVGLTGGIGSGKSTVCSLFSEQGAAIIDTDVLARDVVKPGTPGLSSLAEHFGKDILLEDGNLDRYSLRRIIFTSEEKRQLLESLIHPLIRERLHTRLREIHASYVIIAIPLLLEKGWQSEVDRILVVDCSEKQQLDRVLERDGGDKTLVNNIIHSQIPRQQRLAAADDIIHNEGDIAAIRAQVERLHSQYTQLAASL